MSGSRPVATVVVVVVGRPPWSWNSGVFRNATARKMKKKIATAVETGKFGYITLYHESDSDKEPELEMVLNLQEVAAVR